MEKIDDLSSSKIVNLIQHEEIKGADLLNACASELEQVRKELNEIQEKLDRLKSREQTLLCTSQDVAKHLKKNYP